MVTGACGILTDWGKLQNVKEVSARDVDIAQSNTVDRSGVAVGFPVIQQEDKSNSADELTEALSLTSWGRSERKLVVFTDGGLDHGGTMSAAGQYAAVIAERLLGCTRVRLGKKERSKLKVLAKQGGVCQGPSRRGSGCLRTGVN